MTSTTHHSTYIDSMTNPDKKQTTRSSADAADAADASSTPSTELTVDRDVVKDLNAPAADVKGGQDLRGTSSPR